MRRQAISGIKSVASMVDEAMDTDACNGVQSTAGQPEPEPALCRAS